MCHLTKLCHWSPGRIEYQERVDARVLQKATPYDKISHLDGKRVGHVLEIHSNNSSSSLDPQQLDQSPFHLR